MEAGKLRDVVVLQRMVKGKDIMGGPIETWGDDRKIRADVRFGSGKETMANGYQNGVAAISVRIRAGIEVDEDMRVWYRGREYQITQVLPGGERMEYVDLVAEHRRSEE